MDSKSLINISKSMSYLLRHGAVKEKVQIDIEGFIKISDIIDWQNKTRNTNELVEIANIHNIISNDNKNRYTLKKEGAIEYVRANQGHSIIVESLELIEITLENVNNYSMVLHGSYQKFKENIINDGLKAMTRQHVHMISLAYEHCFQLLRNDIDMYVVVDIKNAIKDGYKFYESTNNVILTKKYIEPKYLTFIDKVKSPCSGVIVIGIDTKNNAYIAMVRTPKNHWSFPKGKKEKGESSFQTSLRELYEETCISPDQLTFCKLPVYFEKSDNNHIATSYYIATLNEYVNIEDLRLYASDPDELVEARWILYDTIVNWKDNDENGYLRYRRIDIVKDIPVSDIVTDLLSRINM